MLRLTASRFLCSAAFRTRAVHSIPSPPAVPSLRLATAIAARVTVLGALSLSAAPVSFASSLPSPSRAPVRSASAMASSASTGSVHDFTVKDARGNDVDLSTFKGNVLLIVNVASQCGLTNSNYTELAQLYEKYKDQGFEILAFPCNQFGGQEPGTNEQILEFACTRFKAEYPIFDKVDVNGEGTAPIYKFLKSSKGGLLGEGIKWNFAKFLVDKDGHVVDRCMTTSPLSIEKDIKKLLGGSQK